MAGTFAGRPINDRGAQGTVSFYMVGDRYRYWQNLRRECTQVAVYARPIRGKRRKVGRWGSVEVRIGRVVGKVILNRCHATMIGATYKIVVPLSLDDLLAERPGQGEDVVAYDELAAGMGALVAISEGREAAQPFHPEEKPVDAYIAAVLDAVVVEPLEAVLPESSGS